MWPRIRSKGDAFVPGTPQLWSQKAPPILGGGSYLALMPDGKRFIVALPDASVEPQKQVTVLLNFGDLVAAAGSRSEVSPTPVRC